MQQVTAVANKRVRGAEILPHFTLASHLPHLTVAPQSQRSAPSKKKSFVPYTDHA